MPWYARPTLEETADGALLIHYTGPTRTEFLASLSWLPVLAFGVFVGSGSLVEGFISSERWIEWKAPILLGSAGLAGIVAAMVLWLVRRWQSRPRTDQLDGQGVERARIFRSPLRLPWCDVPQVDWRLDLIDLSERGSAAYLFHPRDFAPGDWTVVRDRIAAALAPRFDLPLAPEPTPPLRWRLVILTSLPALALLGGGTLLMRLLTAPQLVVASILAIGGTFQYLLLITFWPAEFPLSRHQNQVHRPRPDVSPAADGSSPSPKHPRGFTVPTLEVADEGAWLLRKDRVGVDDCSRPIAATLVAAITILMALVWVFEPVIDAQVREPNPKAVVFFSTIALAAVVWTIAEIRRAVREFDRGTWRVEKDRVTFVGHDGATQSLRTGEIERVFWDRQAVRLRGQGVEIRLVPHGVPSTKWQPVRERLRAMLAPRFDLGSLPPPPNAGRRFLGAAWPLAVIPAVAVPVALAVPPDRLNQILLGWFALTILANAHLIRVVRRDRADWLWRRPRFN